MIRKNKLWKYTQSEFPKADKDKAIEAADMMTPTITADIQANLTEDESNNGYRMYQRFKELLQPMGETQFMREYYTLSYRLWEHLRVP